MLSTPRSTPRGTPTEEPASSSSTPRGQHTMGGPLGPNGSLVIKDSVVKTQGGFASTAFALNAARKVGASWLHIAHGALQSDYIHPQSVNPDAGAHRLMRRPKGKGETQPLDDQENIVDALAEERAARLLQGYARNAPLRQAIRQDGRPRLVETRTVENIRPGHIPRTLEAELSDGSVHLVPLKESDFNDAIWMDVLGPVEVGCVQEAAREMQAICALCESVPKRCSGVLPLRGLHAATSEC